MANCHWPFWSRAHWPNMGRPEGKQICHKNLQKPWNRTCWVERGCQKIKYIYILNENSIICMMHDGPWRSEWCIFPKFLRRGVRVKMSRFLKRSQRPQLSFTWYMMQDLGCLIVLFFWFNFQSPFGYPHPSGNGDKRGIVFGSAAAMSSRWKIPRCKKCKSLITLEIGRLGHFCNPDISFCICWICH